jgi:hypothetical protein
MRVHSCDPPCGKWRGLPFCWFNSEPRRKGLRQLEPKKTFSDPLQNGLYHVLRYKPRKHQNATKTAKTLQRYGLLVPRSSGGGSA